MKRKKFVPSASYNIFLSRLRLARQEAGVSQRQIAKLLGMHHSRINRAEEAKRALDLLEVRQWCQALGLSVVDFTRELDAALNATDAGPSTGSPSSSGEEE